MIENYEDIEIEFLENYTIFLSTTIESHFVQRSIITEHNIVNFFALLGYIELIDNREERPLQEICGGIILIIESLISNKELLLSYSMNIVKGVLPLLFKELQS